MIGEKNIVIEKTHYIMKCSEHFVVPSQLGSIQHSNTLTVMFH